MSGPLYLAWRALAARKGRAALLVGCVTIPLFLPLGLSVAVERMGRELGARAATTPLVVGAKGSPLDLVLGALYFETHVPAPTAMAQADRIRESGLAQAIPLHVGFTARGFRIVGTTLDYFGFRGLRASAGRMPGLLGECVLGAEVASRTGAGPGDKLLSSPGSLFDLAGTYPLRMQVCGVLARAHSPDDRAVFVDIRTAWIIAGLAHGHGALRPGEILAQEGGTTVANASVVQHGEVTPENAASFHFHGDPGDLPVHALLVLPEDAKSATILKGRYLDPRDPCQILAPSEVMRELVATIAKAKRIVAAGFAIVGAASLLAVALIFLLGYRLRRREFETLRKIGCARRTVGAMVAWEVALVLGSGAILAALLAAATAGLSPALLRTLIL